MSTASPSQEVLDALENAHIPATFADFPNLQIHPIAHIPLPSHPHLCLTNYVATDAPHLHELINDPLVAPGLATPKLVVFNIEAAEQRVQRVLNQRRGWCFPGRPLSRAPLTVVVRPIEELSKPAPKLAGWLHFGPDSRFTHAGSGPRVTAYQESAADLPISEQQWVMGFALNPEYHRQGIMTAVIDFILDNWFIPTMKPSAGQLSSSYFPSNEGSEAIHRKLNFLPVATTRYWAGRDLKPDEEEAVICIWQGAGECKLEDSIYSELPPYP